MKSDLSNFTFDPAKRYLRVLQQQGRVELDADDNEQAAILLRYLRVLAADLIGPAGGPDPAPGSGEELRGPFALRAPRSTTGQAIPGVYELTAGRYWVSGLPCELAAPGLRSDTAGSPLPKLEAGTPYLLYLDVWEQAVHWIQDAAIREVALGGADTASRSRLVWRVKSFAVSADDDREDVEEAWEDRIVPAWQPADRGLLRVRAGDPPKEPDLCVADPDARYRGLENRFYRVEVHRSGTAGEATFKWSRDNGSAVFRVLRVEGELAFLENLGRDARGGLAVGDWVELADDGTEALSGDLEAGATPRPLYRVEEVLQRKLAVRLAVPQDVLAADPNADLPQYDEDEAAAKHALVRRWDHRKADPKTGAPALAGGAAVIAEGSGMEGWLTLEDGLQIQFQDAPGATYRTGDFWWFAARTATGDVEWPGERDDPEALPPHGVDHFYAPLAILSAVAGGVFEVTDCRRLFPPAAVPAVP